MSGGVLFRTPPVQGHNTNPNDPDPASTHPVMPAKAGIHDFLFRYTAA